jgi:DNA-binding NarL/FixJ family response regulator
VRVFIADDSKAILDRLRALVSEFDEVEVVGEAAAGAEALESIMRVQPDVVILDIQMPLGNRISVLEAIRKANPDVLVIMLTNYPFPQYEKRCRTAGADFFLDKSGQFHEITSILNAMLHGEKYGLADRK